MKWLLAGLPGLAYNRYEEVAEMKKVVVAVTGASGMPLSRRLMEILAMTPGLDLGCMVSAGARKVLYSELGEDETLLWALSRQAWRPEDMEAGPAGGTWWRPAQECAMIIAPCSMSALGAIANGISSDLIRRAADVALKERVRLIAVIRETPLSTIHIRNMGLLAAAGAVIMPFSPGFYFRPASIEDMLDQFCYKILDQIGVEHNGPGWPNQK